MCIRDSFVDVPKQARLLDSLDLPDHLGEIEVERILSGLASKNMDASSVPSFLGAGLYRHFVPAAVDHLIQRGEFLTAYTPYQPEVSQGTLQAHFEFQSMVCQLTGMDVANAGMYDGSTALSEAVLMACRITKKSSINVMDSVSPHYREVLKTFLEAPGIKIESATDGINSSNESHACLIVQQPNYFGYFEDLTKLSEARHPHSGTCIFSFKHSL